LIWFRFFIMNNRQQYSSMCLMFFSLKHFSMIAMTWWKHSPCSSKFEFTQILNSFKFDGKKNPNDWWRKCILNNMLTFIAWKAKIISATIFYNCNFFIAKKIFNDGYQIIPCSLFNNLQKSLFFTNFDIFRRLNTYISE